MPLRELRMADASEVELNDWLVGETGSPLRANAPAVL